MIPPIQMRKASVFVFIRHAKSDVKEAEAIAAALEERGLKCWIVRPGRSWRRDYRGHREIRVVSSRSFGSEQ
jgi:hypothetical protein